MVIFKKGDNVKINYLLMMSLNVDFLTVNAVMKKNARSGEILTVINTYRDSSIQLSDGFFYMLNWLELVSTKETKHLHVIRKIKEIEQKRLASGYKY